MSGRKTKLPKELEDSVVNVLAKKKCAGLSPYHSVFHERPSEKDFSYFAETMGDWFPLLPSLGILFQEGKDIEEKYRSPREKRIAVLMLFSEKHGINATYSKLMLAFFNENRRDLVRKVIEKAAERWQQDCFKEEEPGSYYDDILVVEKRTAKRSGASSGSMRSKERASVMAAVNGELTVNSVVEVLSNGEFSASHCQQLGLRLQIKPYVLRNIQSNRREVELQLYDIIDHWLNNDEEASWDKLAEALWNCNYKVLAGKIRGENSEEQPFRQDDDLSAAARVTKDNAKEVTNSGALERSTIRKRGIEKVHGEVDQESRESEGSEGSKGGVKYYVITAAVIIIIVTGGVAWVLSGHSNGGFNDRPADSDQKYPIKDRLQLFEALADIGDWQSLCEYLRVATSAMEALKYSTMDLKLKKNECLRHYFKNNDPNWGEVVKVVAKHPISDKKLACKIAEKHMNMSKKTCQSYVDS